VRVDHRGGAHAPDEAPLGGPCGLDGYSSGMCDKIGKKIMLSCLWPYGESFGMGNVVSVYIASAAMGGPEARHA